MTFRQFALNNVRRNGRAYLAFFLSSSFMVMIFFCYAMLIFHPGLLDHRIGDTTRVGMIIAEYIIFIFSFLFVLYSISTFLKVRQKEFGVLVLLGATTGQINRLVFMENMIIGLASVITGLAGGLLLSRGFLLLSANVVDLDLPFYWPLQAIGMTSAAFLALFLLLSLFTLLFIRKNRIVELLRGVSKPKKEPKTSLWLALFAVALLTVSVIKLNKEMMTSGDLFLAAFTGILGTYFFYTQLTVPLIRVLKKNRRLFWKGTNLLWISEMAYKLKDNARMLFLVNVFIALACMSAGLIISLDLSFQRMYDQKPYAIVYKVNNEAIIEEETAGIEAIFQQNGVAFERVDWPSVYINMASDSDSYSHNTELVPLSQAKQSPAHYLQQLPEQLSSDTGYLYVNSSFTKSEVNEQQTLRAESVEGVEFSLAGVEEVEFLEGGASRQLILSDETYSRILQQYGAEDLWSRTQIFYHVPAWEGENPDPRHEAIVVSNEMMDWLSRADRGPEHTNYINSKAQEYLEINQGTSVLGFISAFVAAIFSIASASFLYFKLFSELNQDRDIYRSLSKVGVSRKEMRQSATIQMIVLFFIPIVISAIQALVVLTPIGQTAGLKVITLPVLLAAGMFFVAQLLFFLIIRARYVGQLKKIMV